MFQNKIAVVTGASRGIGRATALALANNGAHVVAIARTIGGLEELDDEIKKTGKGSATLVPLDVTDTPKLQALGPSLIARYPKIDVLISSAGYLEKLTSIAGAPQGYLPRVLATNVTANVNLIQTLHPLLRNAPDSRSVFLTADEDIMGKAYWGYYGASFAALKALVHSYAAENPEMWIKTFTPKPTQTRLRAEAYPGLTNGQTPEQTAADILQYLSLG